MARSHVSLGQVYSRACLGGRGISDSAPDPKAWFKNAGFQATKGRMLSWPCSRGKLDKFGECHESMAPTMI
jgi:hypothetical protein